MLKDLSTFSYCNQRLQFALRWTTLQACTQAKKSNATRLKDIYLKTISQGISAFDATQQAQLENIIWQCPLAGGVAVFKARSLYSLVNDSLQYNDYEDCNQVGLAWRTQQINTTPKSIEEVLSLKVYPNPTNDKITFSFGKVVENATISIYNSLGELIIEDTISQKESIEYNLKHYSTGIYYYVVNNKESGKFVIIR